MTKEEKVKINEIITLTKGGEIGWVETEPSKKEKRIENKEISILSNRFLSNWQGMQLIFIESRFINLYSQEGPPEPAADTIMWKDEDIFFYFYIRKNNKTETAICYSEGLLPFTNPMERLLKEIKRYVRKSSQITPEKLEKIINRQEK